MAGHVAMTRNLIRALRAEIAARGLTQLDVDHRAGLGEGHCSAILNGKRIPKIDTVQRILDVLALDLAFAPRETVEPPQ
jgi:transcriptional regulator with XRE-family HTH domain